MCFLVAAFSPPHHFSCPMEEDGVKTEASDRKVTQQFVGEQVMLGVEALQQILDGKKTIRHIRFSW